MELKAFVDEPPRGWAGLGDRWQALRLRWLARRARQEERAALTQLGSALASATPENALPWAALDEVLARHRAIGEARASVASSLDGDRRDYATVASWMRPLVVVRGTTAGWVLAHQLRQAEEKHRAACRSLGSEALQGCQQLQGAAAGFAGAARSARLEAEDATAREAALLAPLGGAVVPARARRAGREAAAISKSLFHTARGRLIPRASGLVGLLAGWLLTNTFTDSELSATLHSLGIGSGPHHTMSAGTFNALQFWLPIVVAGLCSYAGSRVGALIRARYAPEPAATS